METLKKRLPKINIPARASIWYTASNILARGMLFIFTPIFTRILTPEEYGIYSLYTSWMGIFTVLETLEISGNLMYSGLEKHKEQKNSYISSALGAEIIAAAVFSALFILFRRRINDITSLGTTLTLLLILQVFLNAASGIYLSSMRYLYKYKAVCFVNLSSGLLTPLLSLFLISVSGLGGLGRILSQVVISLVFTLPITVILIKKDKNIFSFEKLKYIFKNALPMLPHYLSMSVIAQSDKIVISHIFGRGSVGKYSVAYSVGFIISLITGGLYSSFSPWINRKLGSGKSDTVRDVLGKILSTLSVFVLIFLCVMPDIFPIIAGKDYRDALPAVYPTALSVIILFLINSHTSAILRLGRGKLLALSGVSGAFASVLLNILIIGKFGYVWGSVSTFLSYILLLAIDTVILKKILGADIVKTSTLVYTVIFLLSFSSILLFLSGSRLSRFIILLALILISIPKLIECKRIIFDK